VKTAELAFFLTARTHLRTCSEKSECIEVDIIIQPGNCALSKETANSKIIFSRSCIPVRDQISGKPISQMRSNKK
jgi:hypothetical protein